MSENQNQEISTEDTEAHGFSSGRIVSEEPDVEGHGFSGRGLETDDAGVEGHGFSSGRIEADEDTEGHGVR